MGGTSMIGSLVTKSNVNDTKIFPIKQYGKNSNNLLISKLIDFIKKISLNVTTANINQVKIGRMQRKIYLKKRALIIEKFH